MSNTYLVRRSNVAGRVPTISQLNVAEFALNTSDHKLYIRSGSNTVLSLNPTHIFNASYSLNTESGVVLELGTNFIANSTRLYVNGLRKKLGTDYSELNGSSISITLSSLQSAITGGADVVIDFIEG